jgi:hypothetical protein
MAGRDDRWRGDGAMCRFAEAVEVARSLYFS